VHGSPGRSRLPGGHVSSRTRQAARPPESRTAGPLLRSLAERGPDRPDNCSSFPTTSMTGTESLVRRGAERRRGRAHRSDTPSGGRVGGRLPGGRGLSGDRWPPLATTRPQDCLPADPAGTAAGSGRGFRARRISFEAQGRCLAPSSLLGFHLWGSRLALERLLGLARLFEVRVSEVDEAVGINAPR